MLSQVNSVAIRTQIMVRVTVVTVAAVLAGCGSQSTVSGKTASVPWQVVQEQFSDQYAMEVHLNGPAPLTAISGQRTVINLETERGTVACVSFYNSLARQSPPWIVYVPRGYATVPKKRDLLVVQDGREVFRAPLSRFLTPRRLFPENRARPSRVARARIVAEAGEELLEVRIDPSQVKIFSRFGCTVKGTDFGADNSFHSPVEPQAIKNGKWLTYRYTLPWLFDARQVQLLIGSSETSSRDKMIEFKDVRLFKRHGQPAIEVERDQEWKLPDGRRLRLPKQVNGVLRPSRVPRRDLELQVLIDPPNQKSKFYYTLHQVHPPVAELGLTSLRLGSAFSTAQASPTRTFIEGPVSPMRVKLRSIQYKNHTQTLTVPIERSTGNRPQQIRR